MNRLIFRTPFVHHKLEGTYHPQPVRRVEIPKPNGGKRMLGIPTMTDRFIQQAIAQVLTKVYDPSAIGSQQIRLNWRMILPSLDRKKWAICTG